MQCSDCGAALTDGFVPDENTHGGFANLLASTIPGGKEDLGPEDWRCQTRSFGDHPDHGLSLFRLRCVEILCTRPDGLSEQITAGDAVARHLT